MDSIVQSPIRREDVLEFERARPGRAKAWVVRLTTGGQSDLLAHHGCPRCQKRKRQSWIGVSGKQVMIEMIPEGAVGDGGRCRKRHQARGLDHVHGRQGGCGGGLVCVKSRGQTRTLSMEPCAASLLVRRHNTPVEWSLRGARYAEHDSTMEDDKPLSLSVPLCWASVETG